MGELAELFRKRTALLITCRGRWQIGKSTLIERLAAREGCSLLKIEGRRPGGGGGRVFRRNVAVGTVAWDLERKERR